MAINLLSNCVFDLDKIKTLYIGSRLVDGNNITYPIQYTTISGSNDSIIAIESWDTINNIVNIGSQQILVNEITNLGDNIVFTEDYVLGSNGKVYEKVIEFTIPKLNQFLINQLKEFTVSARGKFALAPTLAFLVDENNQNLIIGYDRALYLQNQNFVIGEENQVTLTYKSTSMSRSRAYQIR